MKTITKEVKIVSLSAKGLAGWLKKKVHNFRKNIKQDIINAFIWIHAKLHFAENKILKTIDVVGKKAEAYLDKRINGVSEVIEDESAKEILL